MIFNLRDHECGVCTCAHIHVLVYVYMCVHVHMYLEWLSIIHLEFGDKVSHWPRTQWVGQSGWPEIFRNPLRSSSPGLGYMCLCIHLVFLHSGDGACLDTHACLLSYLLGHDFVLIEEYERVSEETSLHDWELNYSLTKDEFLVKFQIWLAPNEKHK